MEIKEFFLGNQIFDLVETDNLFGIQFNDYTHKIDFPNFVNETKKKL